MIFLSQYGSLIELKKCLAKVCHTCKLVRPFRSSHCRTCNRCVLAFDHHCPYIGNCVGYNNRLWFYSFTFFTSLMALSNLRFCYLILYENRWFYALWFATLLSSFYSFMAVSLFISAVSSYSFIKSIKYKIIYFIFRLLLPLLI
jgi:predicted amidophosphoribosyltransferase